MESPEDVFKRVNKDALLNVASSAADGLKCQLDTGIPIVGCGYVILVIYFPDIGNRWMARFPLDQEFSFLESCVEPLEYVGRNFSHLPAPQIHGYSDAGRETPVGAAYMLLDWIDGTPLKPWDHLEPPAPTKHKVLEQLAEFMLDMILADAKEGITYYGVPDGTPKHTPVTTTTWLTESVDRGLRRCFRRNVCGSAIDYLIQRSMVPRYVVPEYDNSPWVVLHGDLHSGNIIVDENFNLRGLIDWDFTFASPLQKAATFPKLLENVPGGAPPEIPETHAYIDLSTEKSYFLTVFAEKERQRTDNTSITRLIETSGERNFFELSLHRPSVHKEFAKRFCFRTPRNIRAALAEIDNFLAANADFRTGSEGQAVKRVASALERLEVEHV